MARGPEPASCSISNLISRSAFLNSHNSTLQSSILSAMRAMQCQTEVRSKIRTDRLVVHSPSSYAPQPGTYVRIRLKDNGTGMPDDVVKNVFNPFFTTKGENGSGLGLPQVYTFMERSGGHINIVSKQGRGTTVDLLFPSIENSGHQGAYYAKLMDDPLIFYLPRKRCGYALDR